MYEFCPYRCLELLDIVIAISDHPIQEYGLQMAERAADITVNHEYLREMSYSVDEISVII